MDSPIDSPPSLALLICKVETISGFEPSHFEHTLTAEELTRAARFKTVELQIRALLARFVVRSALSWYKPSIASSDWVFGKQARGKPFIQNPLENALSFNLSHSTDTIVLALAPFPVLGVDVEHIHPERNHSVLDIAEHSFSGVEVAELKSLDPQSQKDHFYRLWTLKEAFIKATGEGLSMGLKTFGFTQLKTKGAAVVSMRAHGKAQQDSDRPWVFWQTQWQQHMLALAAQPSSHEDPLGITPHTLSLVIQNGAIQTDIMPLANDDQFQTITLSESE